MDSRFYALFGIFGPLVVYLSIIVSLFLSPWFNWEINALSDLGHAVNSEVASIFNFGLLIAGFLLMIYSVTIFRKNAKYSSYCLLISTFFIQLLATFNEIYGNLHNFVAIPHFILLSLTSIVYTFENKSRLAMITFLLVMLSWLIYVLRIFNIGIAFPETMSKLVILWIMYSAFCIYRNKNNFNKL